MSTNSYFSYYFLQFSVQQNSSSANAIHPPTFAFFSFHPCPSCTPFSLLHFCPSSSWCLLFHTDLVLNVGSWVPKSNRKSKSKAKTSNKRAIITHEFVQNLPLPKVIIKDSLDTEISHICAGNSASLLILHNYISCWWFHL